MIKLKVEHPVMINGAERNDLIRHYAIDGHDNYYYIIQKETGIKYQEAIDVYPCRYTYKTTDEKIDK